MSNRIYLPQNASKARQREAVSARKNRVDEKDPIATALFEQQVNMPNLRLGNSDANACLTS